ncbi:glycosyltransferase family 4 protein [Marinobacter sediminum]|uniref:glycosyltransferase family 4 protein n=1 Tax=Marinobacter sediminum TaxID=256323 RepID=UPI001939D184|nr:glycosyltransferase family 4 protein [Marinobacter sediminum]
MKILWLSHLVPYPPKGGVLQRSFNLIKEAAREHEITLLCFNQRAFLESTLPEVTDPLELACSELLNYVQHIKVFEIPEDKLLGGKLWVVTKAILKGSSYNMEWLKSDPFRKELINKIKSDEFDVVHVDTISLCAYFDVIHEAPLILNHHNFESKMLMERSRKEKNKLKRIFYAHEARRLLDSEKNYIRKVQLNITCSDDDANDIRAEVGVDNVMTIPNGVDLSYFSTNRSVLPIANRIVLVGGLSWYPNRDAVEYFLQEVWPLLKERVPTAEVDIIGRSPTESMTKFAEQEPRVHVQGFVDDVRPYLWRSEFYLCPIRIGGGTKLKILDALASGCCIIAHPFACKGIEVREGEHVLFAESGAEYVDKIELLNSDPELRARLRERGPKLIESSYSYEGIGRTYSSAVTEAATKAKNQGVKFDEFVVGKSSV